MAAPSSPQPVAHPPSSPDLSSLADSRQSRARQSGAFAANRAALSALAGTRRRHQLSQRGGSSGENRLPIPKYGVIRGI